jgi:hypothetical protein
VRHAACTIGMYKQHAQSAAAVHTGLHDDTLTHP